MANILTADLPSDDELDDDFDPTKDNGGSGDEKKRSAASRKRLRNSGPLAAHAEGRDNGEEGAAARPDPRAAAKKAKGPRGFSLAALCRPVAKRDALEDKDRSWMAQLGMLRKPAGRAQLGNGAASAEAPEGQAAAAPATAAAIAEPRGQNGAGQAAGPPGSGAQPDAAEALAPATAPGPQTDADEATTRARAAAAAALAAAKGAASTTAAAQHGRVTVTETRRFAGKEIQMSRSVAEAELEAEKAAKRKQAGLDAVLASLQAAKKVNVLDKSRADWSTFKQANTQVEEELEAYKRSGGQYLDKVDFLKRAELAEYQKERDLRLASDVRNRGRM
ncbi:hypothetical protein WJX81_005189 [Elliptochloris bilobata]|uniref:BCNT-C domain-containing protein n=1 Tax=Elliptochloris bilobata TaxID=381761 RepID=A0AAW1S3K1_9CHLO